MPHRTTLIAILASAVIGIALFALKYQVRDLENELTGINRQIIAHREAIHVLNAEWSYLNEPERLTALSKRFLQLQPTTSDRIGSFASLPMAVDGAPAVPAVASAPAAAGKHPVAPGKRPPAFAQNGTGANGAGAEDFTPQSTEAIADERLPQ